MSIVTTLYHSEILIWIRLCHVRGLRKWGSFFLFSPHSFLFPFSLSHLHAASLQALWCACFNLELNGICGAAVPIGGRITDPRVHCGMPPFWWVGVKIAVKQQSRAGSPRKQNAFPMQILKYRKSRRVAASVFHLRKYHLWACGTNNCWLYKYSNNKRPIYIHQVGIAVLCIKGQNRLTRR